jgi:hypothetical protein
MCAFLLQFDQNEQKIMRKICDGREKIIDFPFRAFFDSF